MTEWQAPTKAEVLGAIQRAFPSEPIPSPGCIGYADYDLEARTADAFFANRPWTDITCKELVDCYDGDGVACLAFMSDGARKYYLPAYLAMAVMESECPEAIIVKLIFSLSLAIDEMDAANLEATADLVESRRTFFDTFTSAQVRAIEAVLRYIACVFPEDTSKEARIALFSYWRSRAEE